MAENLLLAIFVLIPLSHMTLHNRHQGSLLTSNHIENLDSYESVDLSLICFSTVYPLASFAASERSCLIRSGGPARSTMKMHGYNGRSIQPPRSCAPRIYGVSFNLRTLCFVSRCSSFLGKHVVATRRRRPLPSISGLGPRAARSMLL